MGQPNIPTDRFRIAPGTRVRLADHDPGWVVDVPTDAADGETAKKRAKALIADGVAALSGMQERLYADDRYSVLIILQALDAAGKDSAIKHVMSGVNPQGCQVFSFKVPSDEELDHNFLWRYAKALPERGRIGIFNRSYYEEVLVVRVHPELVERQRLTGRTDGKAFWQARYDDINAFERHLTRNGTVILKFFLNISRDEQCRRFIRRLEKPEKNWKFSHRDVEERSHWDAYMQAYEDALSATSTEWAPWHVVPADHKWTTRLVVSGILVERLRALRLRFPEVPPEERAAQAAALKQLRCELDRDGGNGQPSKGRPT